jgi:hypothetical protein
MLPGISFRFETSCGATLGPPDRTDELEAVGAALELFCCPVPGAI